MTAITDGWAGFLFDAAVTPAEIWTHSEVRMEITTLELNDDNNTLHAARQPPKLARAAHLQIDGRQKVVFNDGAFPGISANLKL